MKTILTLTAIGVLATPAFAGKHRPASTKAKPVAAAPVKKPAPAPVVVEEESAIVKVKDEPIKLKLGEDFVIKSERASAKPDVVDETFEAKAVSNKEAVKVIKAREDELEYCWVKLPPKSRVETSAVMHLAIEASGSVAGVWFDGTLPAAVEKCMAERAQRWQFPAADQGCELEHGVSFSLLEAKGK